MPFVPDLHTHIYEFVGFLGFCCYVGNYLRLTFNYVTSACRSFFAVNLVAASMVLIGLSASFNLAAAMIQVFWLVISIIGLIVRSRGVTAARA